MNLIVYEPITDQIYILNNVNKRLKHVKHLLCDEFNVYFELGDAKFLILEVEEQI